MTLSNLAASIEAAFGGDELDCLARAIWQGHGAGNISDTEAQELAERIASRRSSRRMPLQGARASQDGRSMVVRTLPFKIKNGRHRPAESRQRRRRLAFSGAMPPALAAHFTIAELAALRIISDDVRSRGRCDACNDEIAARAGVSKTSVQNAVRQAVRLGLLSKEERRYRRRRSDPNVLTIISREWLAWLRRGGRVQDVRSHGYDSKHILTGARSSFPQEPQPKGLSFPVRSSHLIRHGVESRHDEPCPDTRPRHDI